MIMMISYSVRAGRLLGDIEK